MMSRVSFFYQTQYSW